MTDTRPDDCLSPVEWAKEHGYSLMHVYRLVNLEQLEAERRDGRWWIPKDAQPRLKRQRREVPA
jgi:hypothetical protein